MLSFGCVSDQALGDISHFSAKCLLKLIVSHQGDRRTSGHINDGLVLLEEEDEEGDAQGNEQTVKDNHEATGKRTSTTRNQAETRKSSFPGKIVNACHVVETGNARIPKTRKSWLKDPGLYRVRVCNDESFSFLCKFMLTILFFSGTGGFDCSTKYMYTY